MKRKDRLTIAVIALAMVVATFFVVLSKRQPTYRGRAVAHALSTFGPAAKVAAPALEKGLKDSETQVRITAAMALSAIDTNTATLTIPGLKEAIANGDPRTRHWAAVYRSTTLSRT